MSWCRRLAVVAALGLLAPGAGTGTASPARTATTVAAADLQARPAPSKRKRVTAKTGKKKVVKRSTRRKARGPIARRAATRRTQVATGGNMPKGFAWPPSAAMIAEGHTCTARLDQLGVVWKPAAATERVATPIVVPSMMFGGVKVVSWFRKPPFVMDCHLAVGVATFAKDLYDLGVREVQFSRIYGYTNVRVGGVTKTALSRHALGLAMDVRAIYDADGREALVARDYNLDDPLLLRVETFLNDSGGFRTVLTPKNDPLSHHDHFHIEVAVEYGE